LKLSDFNNKNGNKKYLDNFIHRLESVEAKKGIIRDDYEETDSEKIWKCAELRHARVMKLAEVMGYDEALSWQRDGITEYELKCELEGAFRVPPEVRYQNKKKRWLWHESSWWMRRFTTIPPLTEYDGQGCNDITGCVPDCRFYEPTGRIEDDELIKQEEEENKKEKEMIEAEYRILGFNDNDSDDVRRQKWQEIHKLRSRILDEKLEYMHQTQHVGPSRERLKEIETTAWAEFYNNKNNNNIWWMETIK
jgi:hypothetical protein